MGESAIDEPLWSATLVIAKLALCSKPRLEA
jgi:hypothetical protein